MVKNISVIFLFAVIVSPSTAIKCFRNLTGESESCPKTTEIAGTAQSSIASIWKTVKDTIQDVTGDDWIDGIGDKIKEATGVDITSHEKNKKWVQATMKKIGLDFDVSGNCYITYDKTSEETVERGCGAVGAAGTLGAKVVNWMQGKSFNFWANSVCFTMPGDGAKEVCMCSKDDCNEDKASARKAVGINANARAAICNGEECPMVDLSKIDSKYDFNSACYTGGEDSIVKCFTSDIMYTPEAAALTRSKRSTDDGYELLNIDGENNYESAAFTMNSGLILRGTSFLMVVFGLAMSLLMYS